MYMKNNYSKINIFFLRISCVLWIIWGLVHVFAVVVTILTDVSTGFAGIADAINPSTLSYNYHGAVGAILNQHGFNLLWGGMVTIIGGVFIWHFSSIAIFVTAMVGGLLDVGYFIFIDLGGYNNFVPGTVMTIISAVAIILSFYAYFISKNNLSLLK